MKHHAYQSILALPLAVAAFLCGAPGSGYGAPAGMLRTLGEVVPGSSTPALAAMTGSSGLLERPPSLEPRVHFWREIMVCYGARDIVIHDSRSPHRILTVTRVPDHLDIHGRAAREWIGSATDTARRRLREAASAIRAGRPDGLPESYSRVLAAGAGTNLAAEAERLATDLRSQQGLRELFQESLQRSGQYLDMIRFVFAESGVPEEIAYLPHLESAFNPRALSKAGAAGLWQFTEATGRRYLRVDASVDERLDPYRATVAAARYLREAHDALGTWPLAIMSYNYGVPGVTRAVERHGTDLMAILENHNGAAMGFAVRSFYASFLAVLDVVAEAEHHFPDTRPPAPVRLSTFVAPAYLEARRVAGAFGVEIETLKLLNPHLTKRVWKGDLWIPPATLVRVPWREPASLDERVLALPPASGGDGEVLACFHRVRRGETLAEIARRAGTTIRRIVALNDLGDADQIAAGQRLQLPCASR